MLYYASIEEKQRAQGRSSYGIGEYRAESVLQQYLTAKPSAEFDLHEFS